MLNKESQKILDEITENKTKYANTTDKISFMTDNIKMVPIERITYLEQNVDRSKVISELSSLLKDIDVAFKIEAGIFEFTLIYAMTRDYFDNIMVSVYNDKVYDLTQNLNQLSSIQNKTLYKGIQTGSINPQTIAFLRPQDLHPEGWDQLVKKTKLREEKKKNMAVTDLYVCRRCKGNKCVISESQERGADEGITKRITCVECYHVMKKC